VPEAKPAVEFALVAKDWAMGAADHAAPVPGMGRSREIWSGDRMQGEDDEMQRDKAGA